MIGKENEICPRCGEPHEADELSLAAEEFTDEVFEDIWRQGKNDLKEMSKKEVAEQMYF